jgi:hypothetical protein
VNFRKSSNLVRWPGLIAVIACAVILLGACVSGLGLTDCWIGPVIKREGSDRSRDRIELAVMKDVPADTSPARPSVEARVGVQGFFNDGPRLRGLRAWAVAFLGQRCSPPSGTIRAIDRGPMLGAGGSQLAQARIGVAPRPPPVLSREC